VKSPLPKELAFDPHIVAHYPPSRRYLVGKPGGRDSVALLHRLTELDTGDRLAILISCAVARAQRMLWVRRLAAGFRRNSSWTDRRMELARRTKHSIESAGCMARYQFSRGSRAAAGVA
jgi:hypothetical protein